MLLECGSYAFEVHELCSEDAKAMLLEGGSYALLRNNGGSFLSIRVRVKERLFKYKLK